MVATIMKPTMVPMRRRMRGWIASVIMERACSLFCSQIQADQSSMRARFPDSSPAFTNWMNTGGKKPAMQYGKGVTLKYLATT
jgi:peptidyl-tRNA hydrolase